MSILGNGDADSARGPRVLIFSTPTIVSLACDWRAIYLVLVVHFLKHLVSTMRFLPSAATRN